jgi:predicted amidohydrolase YtcJ
MCTYNGAWTTFDEADRGSLEPGKLADMAILSENPYEVPASELGRLKVEGLILSGKPYEPQNQGVAKAVLRGAFGHGNC